MKNNESTNPQNSLSDEERMWLQMLVTSELNRLYAQWHRKIPLPELERMIKRAQSIHDKLAMVD